MTVPYALENLVQHDGYALEMTAEGVRLFVNGLWTPQIEAAVDGGAVHTLVLNVAHGFAEPSLEFIRPWPLKELHVLLPSAEHLSPIARLKESLKALKVEIFPAGSGVLDLTGFSHLRDLSISWRMVKDQLENLSGLDALYLDAYQESDLGPLSPLISLRTLRMKERPRLKALYGLEAFRGLERLAIHGASMLSDDSSLQASSSTQTLRELQLESCRKLSRLDNVAMASGLQFLNLGNCGDLESLVPIRSMRDLRRLYLYESTKILDGDLSPLLDLDFLMELRLASRRQYDPPVHVVQNLIERRPHEAV